MPPSSHPQQAILSTVSFSLWPLCWSSIFLAALHLFCTLFSANLPSVTVADGSSMFIPYLHLLDGANFISRLHRFSWLVIARHSNCRQRTSLWLCHFSVLIISPFCKMLVAHQTSETTVVHQRGIGFNAFEAPKPILQKHTSTHRHRHTHTKTKKISLFFLSLSRRPSSLSHSFRAPPKNESLSGQKIFSRLLFPSFSSYSSFCFLLSLPAQVQKWRSLWRQFGTIKEKHLMPDLIFIPFLHSFCLSSFFFYKSTPFFSSSLPWHRFFPPVCSIIFLEYIRIFGSLPVLRFRDKRGLENFSLTFVIFVSISCSISHTKHIWQFPTYDRLLLFSSPW